MTGGPFTKINGQSHFRIARLLKAAIPARTLFDYDGDGRADITEFRPSENKWYILQSATSLVRENDFALAGDGKADVAVFPLSTDVWYLLQTTAGFGAVQWGNFTDTPTPNAFLP